MKEGDKISPSLLKSQWEKVMLIYDEYIENGHKVRPIRFLIRFVLESSLSKKLVAGVSMFALLISLPEKEKVDYSRTLRVEIDQLKDCVKMSYIKNNENLWSESCQLTEVVDLFKTFLIKYPEWPKT